MESWKRVMAWTRERASGLALPFGIVLVAIAAGVLIVATRPDPGDRIRAKSRAETPAPPVPEPTHESLAVQPAPYVKPPKSTLESTVRRTGAPTAAQTLPATVQEPTDRSAPPGHPVSALVGPDLEWKDARGHVIARRSAAGHLTLISRDESGRPASVAACAYSVSPDRASAAVEADHAWLHTFIYGAGGAVIKETDCAGQTHDYPPDDARRVDLTRGTALAEHTHVREAGFKGRAPTRDAPIPTTK